MKCSIASGSISSQKPAFFSLRPSTIQDKPGKVLTEEKEILSRWTEYCSELYNYESCGDNAVLDCSQPPEEDLQPILREEVEIAVASLKKGKSAGVGFTGMTKKIAIQYLKRHIKMRFPPSS